MDLGFSALPVLQQGTYAEKPLCLLVGRVGLEPHDPRIMGLRAGPLV